MCIQEMMWQLARRILRPRNLSVTSCPGFPIREADLDDLQRLEIAHAALVPPPSCLC